MFERFHRISISANYVENFFIRQKLICDVRLIFSSKVLIFLLISISVSLRILSLSSRIKSFRRSLKQRLSLIHIYV